MRPAVGLAMLLLLLAACGGSSAKLSEAPPPLAKQLMTKRLKAMRLDYKWVACVRVGRTFKHVPITRCNVDFGIDPHVEGYCLLLKDGKLVTNHEDSGIPCKHDDAGWDKTTVSSS